MTLDFSINADEFESRRDEIRSIFLHSFHKPVRIIEYRTADEGMCNARLFVVSQEDVQDEFEAYFTLLNRMIHFDEEWPFEWSESNEPEGVDSFIESWIKHAVSPIEGTFLSKAQVREHMDRVVLEILDLLGETRSRDYDRWGVFVDGKAIPISRGTLEKLGVAEIVSGFGFDLLWNAVDILYQTHGHFVWFSWHTDA